MRREAVGVVGAIVPWNFPFEVTIQKLGQALATGNTVVLKRAPDTPFNATRLGRLIAQRTDIPAGVVNVVTASDHLVGEQLTVSPKVDLISFTGSTAVGCHSPDQLRCTSSGTAKFTVAIGLYGAMAARKSAAADGMCCCETRSRPRPVPPRGRNTFQRGPRRAHRPRP